MISPGFWKCSRQLVSTFKATRSPPPHTQLRAALRLEGARCTECRDRRFRCTIDCCFRWIRHAAALCSAAVLRLHVRQGQPVLFSRGCLNTFHLVCFLFVAVRYSTNMSFDPSSCSPNTRTLAKWDAEIFPPITCTQLGHPSASGATCFCSWFPKGTRSACCRF